MYINDMYRTSRILIFIHFADDTTVFLSGDRHVYVVSKVNRELMYVDRWMIANRLLLNVDKTIHVLITDSVIDHVYSGSLRGVYISRVSHTKFLGIYTPDQKFGTRCILKKIQFFSDI